MNWCVMAYSAPRSSSPPALRFLLQLLGFFESWLVYAESRDVGAVWRWRLIFLFFYLKTFLISRFYFLSLDLSRWSLALVDGERLVCGGEGKVMMNDWC